MIREAFAAVVRRPTFDVPYAALLLARDVAYPDLVPQPYLAELDTLAQAAARALPPSAGDEERAVALASYLAAEAGFQGNVVAYGDPHNSFLNDVLERRQGIPITLSIIYVAVASRLGLEAYGVGLPGHFIAGVRAGHERVLLDQFHGGVRLTLADCELLVQETAGYEGPLDPAWLKPASPRAIVGRMLNNLRMVYLQRAEWQQALVVLKKLQEIQPDEPAHLRDRGLILYQQGDLYAAAHCLEAYLEQDPDSPAAMAIRQNLTAEFARWARQN
jgi:regulator of sirC expression with transglutaminase-like and TPR domain